VGNEENKYPVLDSNKTKINDAKEPNDAHRNIFKEEIPQVITENFMEMLLDMVNQNVKETLKKFQDIKNKKYENTETNELKGAQNEHQSEMQNTINREISGLRGK
jgi:hypothetical protein